MCKLRGLARVSVFPLLFAGSGMLAWWGHSPVNAHWLMPALVLGVLLLAFALERWMPFAPAWNRQPGKRQDLAWLGLTTLSVQVAEALVWLLVLGLVGQLAGSVAWWPTHWPLLAQIVLALALGDLLPYLYHRASHESSGWLWRVHAVHHAPSHLHSLNFARFHPLNAFLTAALTLLPLALLGAPAVVLFVAAVLHNVHGVLSHANIDVRLGPLNRVFSMAELHRWHHARDLAQANGNYGATLLLWDWLLGTRRAPGRQVQPDAVGLAAASAGSVPTGLLAQLLAPFLAAVSRGRRWTCCG